MIIKASEVNKKEVGPMIIREYPINNKFSGVFVDINGDHGKIKCLNEDRIYFIISGKGKFVVGGKEDVVEANDLIFIPKNTTYNLVGKMKYFLVCSPKFNPADDVFL
ncbi:hypothetical protein KAJ89_05500 [Candidatus Parcubacteria bacterium]|nr:hypothetical protein [Candidatus Parcubacteria bacterium]